MKRKGHRSLFLFSLFVERREKKGKKKKRYKEERRRRDKEKRRWKKKKKLQMKKQRNYLMVSKREMKNLSKFFLEKKTNNSNLISTSNPKTRFFFSSKPFSLLFSFFPSPLCSPFSSLVYLFLKLLFGKWGWTALHLAAQKGFEEIVKILLEHGSNVDLQNNVLIFIFFLPIFICCC